MKSVYTVSQINKYIKGLFSSDGLLASVFVKGEVSNLKYHTSGHVYFSLKDNNSFISCVMFAGKRQKGLAFRMQDGDKVVIGGQIDVYENAGKYQLYADEIRKEGQGDLYERYLKLKKQLEEMGMFDAAYKLPVKKYNMKIGVVTAPTGAVIQDIRNVSGRRNPYVQIYLYPALVQGEGAKESIVKGIEFFNEFGVDVIIVGRGGGSIEDLWAFNEECVARAIFASKIPVISAVGHETDVTISDMVADLRAPTPSAAAELAVFDYREFKEQLEGYALLLRKPLYHRLEILNEKISRLKHTLELLSPEKRIRDKRLRLDELRDSMTKSLTRLTEDKKRCIERIAERYSRYAANAAEPSRMWIRDLSVRISDSMGQNMQGLERRLAILIERMKGLAPFDRLKQGFSFVENEDRKNVRSITQVKKGDRLNIRMSDGTVTAAVESVRRRDG